MWYLFARNILLYLNLAAVSYHLHSHLHVLSGRTYPTLIFSNSVGRHVAIMLEAAAHFVSAIYINPIFTFNCVMHILYLYAHTKDYGRNYSQGNRTLYHHDERDESHSPRKLFFLNMSKGMFVMWDVLSFFYIIYMTPVGYKWAAMLAGSMGYMFAWNRQFDRKKLF